MFALDTNTIVHYFKGIGRVAENLLATPPSQTCVPSVVVYEIRVGLERYVDAPRRVARFADLLSQVRTLPFGLQEAAAAARIRAAIEREGAPIGPMDTLIAGTALANGATLVTRNLREFGRVEGLSVVSWF